MGNNSSTTDDIEESRKVCHYTGFIYSDGDPTISKECFLAKFEQKLNNLGEAIWMKSCGSKDCMNLSSYEGLIHELSAGSSNLAFFIECASCLSSNTFDYSTLFSWCNFGRPLDESLLNSLLKAIGQETSAVDVDFIKSRMRSLLPDIAGDLSKLVSNILLYPVSVMDNLVEFPDCSPLLTEGIFWLLSVLLSSPYKRFSETVSQDSAPFEYEKLMHLRCLFTSVNHGFSLTRIMELSFDYKGPVIILLKTAQYMYCICSDQGLRDSMKPYGSREAYLFRIFPTFAKLISGGSSGIIYSNFSAKTARQGFMVGHEPICSPALEVMNGFTELSFASGPVEKLLAVEIWAAGSTQQLDDLASYKAWDLQQVNKAKNRKVKLDEDWRNNSDRTLLDLAGVSVRHSDAIGPHNPE